MRQSYADQFEVLNGPEDGAAFAITRVSFHIGSDPSCVVPIRMDGSVHRFNALVTAVSDGYRVRRLGGAPVFADGKRAGKILSRILRPGSVLRVGDTELLLQCSPGGLASRSRGLPMQNDAVWALRLLLENLGVMAAWILQFILQMRGRMRWFLAGLVFGGLTLWYFRPSWAAPIIDLGYYLAGWVRVKVYEWLGV